MPPVSPGAKGFLPNSRNEAQLFGAVKPPIGLSLQLAPAMVIALPKRTGRLDLQQARDFFWAKGIRKDAQRRMRLNARGVRIVVTTGARLRHNGRTERCGRASAPELPIEVARPHSP